MFQEFHDPHISLFLEKYFENDVLESYMQFKRIARIGLFDLYTCACGFISEEFFLIGVF